MCPHALNLVLFCHLFVVCSALSVLLHCHGQRVLQPCFHLWGWWGRPGCFKLYNTEQDKKRKDKRAVLSLWWLSQQLVMGHSRGCGNFRVPPPPWEEVIPVSPEKSKRKDKRVRIKSQKFVFGRKDMNLNLWKGFLFWKRCFTGGNGPDNLQGTANTE